MTRYKFFRDLFYKEFIIFKLSIFVERFSNFISFSK
jgi:hypothetical protein